MNLDPEELLRRLARLMTKAGRKAKAQAIEEREGFEKAEAYLREAEEEARARRAKQERI